MFEADGGVFGEGGGGDSVEGGGGKGVEGVEEGGGEVWGGDVEEVDVYVCGGALGGEGGEAGEDVGVEGAVNVVCRDAVIKAGAEDGVDGIAA